MRFWGGGRERHERGGHIIAIQDLCVGRRSCTPTRSPACQPTSYKQDSPVAVAHVQHEELGRSANLRVLRVGVVAGASPGVRHEHQQAGRLQRRQARLLAAGLRVAGDDIGVEGGDALPPVVGSVVVAVRARVAAVPARGKQSNVSYVRVCVRRPIDRSIKNRTSAVSLVYRTISARAVRRSAVRPASKHRRRSAAYSAGRPMCHPHPLRSPTGQLKHASMHAAHTVCI